MSRLMGLPSESKSCASNAGAVSFCLIVKVILHHHLGCCGFDFETVFDACYFCFSGFCNYGRSFKFIDLHPVEHIEFCHHNALLPSSVARSPPSYSSSCFVM